MYPDHNNDFGEATYLGNVNRRITRSSEIGAIDIRGNFDRLDYWSFRVDTPGNFRIDLDPASSIYNSNVELELYNRSTSSIYPIGRSYNVPRRDPYAPPGGEQPSENINIDLNPGTYYIAIIEQNGFGSRPRLPTDYRLFVTPPSSSSSGGSGSPGSPSPSECPTGTDGDDILEATSNCRDLNGFDGDDSLQGNDLRNILYGHGGNDSISGEGGDDLINGGNGDDLLYSGSGNDRLDGGSGDDYLVGTSGNNTLQGGFGNDYLAANSGNDSLSGGDGNDSLRGNGGNDTLNGESGNDSLDGGFGNDHLNAGSGNDSLNGERGDDYLHGMDDNDLLLGDEGNDSLMGGSGDDSLEGGSGNDFFNGLDDNDRIFGNEGDDCLHGGHDNDSLEGGDDNDTLHGDTDDDYLNGGDGDDLLIGYWSFAEGVAHEDVDTLSGGRGADTFVLGRYSEERERSEMFYHQGPGYAIIEDFNRREGDKIQVFGSTENVSFSPGTMDGRDVTRIYYGSGSDEDLVAIVLDSSDIGMYDVHYLSPISQNPVFDNVLPPIIFTPSLPNQFFPSLSF